MNAYAAVVACELVGHAGNDVMPLALRRSIADVQYFVTTIVGTPQERLSFQFTQPMVVVPGLPHNNFVAIINVGNRSEAENGAHWEQLSQ